MLLLLIQLLHILFIMFMILAPISDNPHILRLHVMMSPLLLLHWYMNNNICSLTLAETMIRRNMGDNDIDNCFTCKIINPIYDFKMNNENMAPLLYANVLMLWGISLYRYITYIREHNISMRAAVLGF